MQPTPAQDKVPQQGALEGWGEGPHLGPQEVPRQLEVPPSNWSPLPPSGDTSWDPSVGPGAQHPGVGPGPSGAQKKAQQKAQKLIAVTQFRYKFFEKPTRSKFCTLETSSWDQKKATLSQEVSRRLETTSKELETKVKIEMLETFCEKLKRSGYS